MNRFTIKELHIVNDMNKAMDKLSKLEDIEDDFGVDLTLLQRLRKEAWIVRKDGVTFEVIGIDFNADDALILYNEDNQEMFTSDLYLKDYGKTWALTKEELEK